MMCRVSKALHVGLALVGCAAPTQAGFADVAALVASRPSVPEPARERLVASPFGTIHAALFAFPRPAGADVPRPTEVSLAGLDLGENDVTASIAAQALIDPRNPPRVFPEVNRSNKGDRLVPKAAPEPAMTPVSPPSPAPQQGAEHAPGEGETTSAVASVAPAAPAAPADPPPVAEDRPAGGDAENDDEAPSAQAARIYFGVEPMGMLAAMQPWSPDDDALVEPTEEAEASPAQPPNRETVAAKGEVTGPGHHPKSPAERLGLMGRARAKAEKCLANAVYFEARAEPVRGQVAVAQVVMNRVFSGYYPNNVCGVVYQNAHRRFACQFSFACDGASERVDEPDAWKRAKEIARDTLDGKLWLPDVGKATHYHAYWVRPIWVREMHKLDRIGVHTFYRPRNWGSGADAPVWGDAATTSETVKKL
ncbi:MAG TPA: cell wall hydrolase [Xanthobacteraceae bacterium]|nr:cell wall hydrolase [Xanthobacteraceae bacterium]